MSLLKCADCKVILRTDDECYPGPNFVWCIRCGKKIEKRTRRVLDSAKITRTGFIWSDGEIELVDWDAIYHGEPGRKPITMKKE